MKNKLKSAATARVVMPVQHNAQKAGNGNIHTKPSTGNKAGWGGKAFLIEPLQHSQEIFQIAKFKGLGQKRLHQNTAQKAEILPAFNFEMIQTLQKEAYRIPIFLMGPTIGMIWRCLGAQEACQRSV